MLEKQELNYERKLKPFKKVIKIFGPEQAAFIEAKVREKVKYETQIFGAIKNPDFLKKELEAIKYHIHQLSQFSKPIMVGCIGLVSGCKGIYLLAPSFSHSELAIIQGALKGDIFNNTDIGVRINIFLPVPILINPIAVQGRYIYIHRGLESILALFKRVGFPVYLIFSSVKVWYPFMLMSDTEIVCLPFEFFDLNKVITYVGLLDFHQLPYLKEREDVATCIVS